MLLLMKSRNHLWSEHQTSAQLGRRNLQGSQHFPAPTSCLLAAQVPVPPFQPWDGLHQALEWLDKGSEDPILVFKDFPKMSTYYFTISWHQLSLPSLMFIPKPLKTTLEPGSHFPITQMFQSLKQYFTAITFKRRSYLLCIGARAIE